MFTARELATVLTSLRHSQQQIAREGLAFADGSTHFVDEGPLPAAEIDTLCDRLNDVDACCDSQLA